MPSTSATTSRSGQIQKCLKKCRFVLFIFRTFCSFVAINGHRSLKKRTKRKEKRKRRSKNITVCLALNKGTIGNTKYSLKSESNDPKSPYSKHPKSLLSMFFWAAMNISCSIPRSSSSVVQSSTSTLIVVIDLWILHICPHVL